MSSIARRKQTLGARAATGAVTDIAMDLDNGDIVMARPETTTGVQLLFNGTYRNVADDNSDNKVPVPRTFFSICAGPSVTYVHQILHLPLGTWLIRVSCFSRKHSCKSL